MNAARRSKRRQNWPRGLYEPRPGYYLWRHPDGRPFTLGAIPLAHAIHQALQANAHVLAERPSLVDRLTGAANLLGEQEHQPGSTSCLASWPPLALSR